jgi:hypothetical protein
MRKAREKVSNLVVRLEDTYDPADYIMVHKTYFDGMREALRASHRRANDEWGGDTSTCICIYCSPPDKASAGTP